MQIPPPGPKKQIMTNIYDLPVPLARALTPDRKIPVEGRFSVTQLIDAPLIRILVKRHFPEIDDDVSDSLWALLGKAVHKIIEQGNEESETKIEVPFLGATIVGIIDWHKDGHTIDWKITSVWSVVFSDGKTWEQQLQIYAWMLIADGKAVDKLSVYMILRDWNKRDAQKNPDYPRIPFHQISFSLWPKERIEAYIAERLSLHLRGDKIDPALSDAEIPTDLWCSPEERWAKKNTWALKKNTNQRAVRVFDTEEAAGKALQAATETAKKGDTYAIEFRKGGDTRCESYCSVAQWCPYYFPSWEKKNLLDKKVQECIVKLRGLKW